MSQFTCDICSFESFGPYDATIWSIQNPWFQNYSSLAGALGEQENQGESPSSQSSFPSFGALEEYEEYETSPASSNTSWGSPELAFEPFVQDLEPDSVLGSASSTSSEASDTEDGHGYYYDNNNNIGDSEPVVNLDDEVPLFCRVEMCRYWHTDHKQLRRHRYSHSRGSFGYLCPNQTATCPSLGNDFSRSDAVNVHCRRSPECGEVLEANYGKIPHWGTLPRLDDLVSYDPDFHKPYRRFDGRQYGTVLRRAD